jgi:hypothetical protein
MEVFCYALVQTLCPMISILPLHFETFSSSIFLFEDGVFVELCSKSLVLNKE